MISIAQQYKHYRTAINPSNLLTLALETDGWWWVGWCGVVGRWWVGGLIFHKHQDENWSTLCIFLCILVFYMYSYMCVMCLYVFNMYVYMYFMCMYKCIFMLILCVFQMYFLCICICNFICILHVCCYVFLYVFFKYLNLKFLYNQITSWSSMEPKPKQKQIFCANI